MENKLIFAKEIIKEAGAFIKESLSKTITVEEKTAYDDLVTNIDKQTQDLLVARIKSSFPSDNIFAEENGLVHNIKDGNVWVLDPIDGTVNFIVQQDNFCVMIAYYEEGHRSMTSLGKNVTFGGTELRLEANIFDFEGDIYGKTIEVFWLDYIRDMIKFNNIDELCAQLEADKKIAEKF